METMWPNRWQFTDFTDLHFAYAHRILYVRRMEQESNIYTVEVGASKLRVVTDEYAIHIDDRSEPVPLRGGTRLRSFIGTLPDGSAVPIYVEEGEEEHEYVVYVRGEAIAVRTVTTRDERLVALRKSAAAGRAVGQMIVAPMPGLLKEMLVSEGDVVEKGTSLCILEAMKMENEIKSPGRFLVKRLIARPGTAVEKGTPLVELRAIDEES